MEHQKTLNLLNEASDSKFVTRKWNINDINDNSKTNYDAANEITYNTEVSKSSLCDYNDAYILVRGDITVAAAPAAPVAFKNCAPFTKCITKTDETTIGDAEGLHLVKPMFNLINIVQIILKQQDVYGFIRRTKQLIWMQILQTLMNLNLSSIRLNY